MMRIGIGRLLLRDWVLVSIRRRAAMWRPLVDCIVRRNGGAQEFCGLLVFSFVLVTMRSTPGAVEEWTGLVLDTSACLHGLIGFASDGSPHGFETGNDKIIYQWLNCNYVRVPGQYLMSRIQLTMRLQLWKSEKSSEG